MLRIRKAIFGILVVSSCFSTPATSDTTLPIAPVYQETPVWCWAAVGEMVFRHYDVPTINPVGDFQCGIVALMHPACEFNCGNCIFPAGSLSYMNDMLRRYPEIARFRTGTPVGRIRTSPVYRSLTKLETKSEMDSGRPVVAGISPSGFSFGGTSQHVALIVGYEEEDETLYLIVNDPFPYGILMFQGRPDPYIAADGSSIESGQYRIQFERFKDRLLWRESIYRIRCDGDACPN
jgi:hypothetical protein